MQLAGTWTSSGITTTTGDVVAPELPDASVAVQVTVVVPVGKEVGAYVIFGFGSTKSVAVGYAEVGIAVKVEVAMNMCDGSDVNIGGVVSTTPTPKVAVVVANKELLDVHETVVVPSAKRVPEAGMHITGSVPSFASVALRLKLTYAPAELVASTVVSDAPLMAGPVTTGAETVIVALVAGELVAPSVVMN